MNYYYITGTGRGIGHALAMELLNNSQNYVIGFSRTNEIRHERFEHIYFDFRNTQSVEDYSFINIIDAESITLINNSAILGSVKPLGCNDNRAIVEAFNVNAIAPFILMNNFIKQYQNIKIRKLIINISSGAGRHPVESWSSYCTTKSALDMVSEVAFAEQAKLDKRIAIKVLSIAPGIVDTNMQHEIRQVDMQDFSQVNTFIKYKNENMLVSPKVTANKIIKIIKDADIFNSPILDIRELDL